MKNRSPAAWAAAMLLAALIPCAWMVATEMASALRMTTVAVGEVANVAKVIPDRLAVLQASLDTLPGKVLPPVLAVVDQRAGEALATVRDFQMVADARLASIQVDAREKSEAVLQEAQGLMADIKPVLANAATLEAAYTALGQDAKDSLDDSYDDLRSLVDSAEVAATQTAQTMETVREVAPKLAESAAGIGKSGDGIAADVHAATTDFVRPKTGWQKFKAWAETAGKIAARFI
jgi:hypothetical protein